MKIASVVMVNVILLFSTASLADDDQSADKRQITGIFEKLTAVFEMQVRQIRFLDPDTQESMPLGELKRILGNYSGEQ